MVEVPAPAVFAQAVPKPRMNVVVVEGEALIHNVRKRQSHDIVVQVRDGNRTPIAGAAVVFTVPAKGPGGEFGKGAKTVKETSDAKGYATARGFRSNTVAGKYEIEVVATHEDQTAKAVVTQFNMTVQEKKGGGSGKWIAVLSAVGAAAAGGAIYGTRGKTETAPPPAPVPIGITPGQGTVGRPR